MPPTYEVRDKSACAPAAMLARLLACALLAVVVAAAQPRRALLVRRQGGRSASPSRRASTQGRPVSLVFGSGFRPVAARAGLAPPTKPFNATVPFREGPLQVLTA